MILKVELFEGRAYTLDEQGRVWELIDTPAGPYCELRLITHLSREAVKHEMSPLSLARFSR